MASLGKLQLDVQLDDKIKAMLRTIFANAKDFFNNPDNVLVQHPLYQDLTELGTFLDQLLAEHGEGQEPYYPYDENDESYFESDNYSENYTESGSPYEQQQDKYNHTNSRDHQFNEYNSPQPVATATNNPLQRSNTQNTTLVSPPAVPPSPTRAGTVPALKPRPPPPPPKPQLKPRPDRPSRSPAAPLSPGSNPTTTLSLAPAFEKGGKITEEDFIQAILLVHFFLKLISLIFKDNSGNLSTWLGYVQSWRACSVWAGCETKSQDLPKLSHFDYDFGVLFGTRKVNTVIPKKG